MEDREEIQTNLPQSVSRFVYFQIFINPASSWRFGSKAWPHKSPARKDQRLVPDELTPPTWIPAIVASTRWCGNSWINAAIIREFPPRRNCPGNLEFGAKMRENPKACPKNKSQIYKKNILNFKPKCLGFISYGVTLNPKLDKKKSTPDPLHDAEIVIRRNGLDHYFDKPEE